MCRKYGVCRYFHFVRICLLKISQEFKFKMEKLNDNVT